MLAGRPALLRDACERAVAYLDGVASRPVAPSEEAVAGLLELGFPLPRQGLGATHVLHVLDEVGSPATVASNGPRYFGFVTGAAFPAAQAASWLSTAWDQNAALTVMSPVAARLGEVAVGWIADLLGLPSGIPGGFVTGATMANATCLAAARDAVLTRHGWDAARDGLVGAPPVTVVVGAEVHATVRKALGIIGLGRDRAVVLPADGQGRIVARDLPALDGPAIVCLQAGNVNTGASDPFPPLIEWAHDHGAWVHVDGAFGLWAAASPATASQVAGVAEAESWATDCHKWLNTTYDCGLALVFDPETLRLRHGGIGVLPARHRRREHAPHPAVLAAGARRRGLGDPGLDRPRRRRRPGRALLPPGAAVRGRHARQRASPCSTTSSSTRCSCRSATLRAPTP